MDRSNLFSDATESSQDAFVCWLLEWAKPQYKNLDAELHECAVEFIRELFAKHHQNAPSTFEEIEIRKQYKKIDVLCIINNRYAILIENKTGTNEHSDQLRRYLEKVRQESFREENILPIYLQTGDQASYSNVREAGYQPFLREDFLEILRSYSGNNPILVDYRNYLQSISDERNAWQSKPPEKWAYGQFVGFYQKLQERLGLTDKNCWDYVSNPDGGFLGFYWHYHFPPHPHPDEIYLSLQKEKLCFKIMVREERKDDRGPLRKRWQEKIMAEGPKYDLDLKKPDRFGNGVNMIVCEYNGDYRVCNNGLIDIERTVARLKKAEELLDAAVTE